MDVDKQILEINTAIPSNLYPESNQFSIDHFHRSIWYAWQYNEIVGYLNLYILGGQFRADVWLVDKKRVNRGIIKKKFKYYGKTLEKQIPRGKSSQEIFGFVVEQLERHNKKNFKNRHFDLRAFKVAGLFIDWKILIEKLNSYKYPEFRKSYFENSR